jgi:hypothetical protein
MSGKQTHPLWGSIVAPSARSDGSDHGGNKLTYCGDHSAFSEIRGRRPPGKPTHKLLGSRRSKRDQTKAAAGKQTHPLRGSRHGEPDQTKETAMKTNSHPVGNAARSARPNGGESEKSNSQPVGSAARLAGSNGGGCEINDTHFLRRITARSAKFNRGDELTLTF